MTTKDYKTIAQVFAQRTISPWDDNSQGQETMRIMLARDLAAWLALDNPRFDADKFLKASNV